VKPEALCGPDGRAVAAKFMHGSGGGVAVDKLAFTLSDGQRYEWRSNYPVSAVGGLPLRFSALRPFPCRWRVVRDKLQTRASDTEKGVALKIVAVSRRQR